MARSQRYAAHSSRPRRHSRPVVTLAVGGLLALAGAAISVAPSVALGDAATHAALRGAVPGLPQPVPMVVTVPGPHRKMAAPITTRQCLKTMGIRCYNPLQYRIAYDLNSLYSAGITGTGKTIVIVDSFGSPTIASDLKTFDKQFGLPDPTLQVMKFGTIPPFSVSNSTMVGWATETTLDVEYAHAMAPGAKIVLAETPVAENEGTSGFPQMMTAEQTLINSGVGDVISQSFGATENTFPGFAQHNFTSLTNLRFAFTDAASHNVTVLGASGDLGATDDQSDGATPFATRVNSWPSSDPLVTSVGGTFITMNNQGKRLSPDVVWNDGSGAGGGGVSGVFARPTYQNAVSSVTGAQRGTPDVAMSAAGASGSAWIFDSFTGTPSWSLVGGTSEATPIFSGIVALADQVAGHDLGQINPKIYALAAAGPTAAAAAGLVDVTTGNNSFDGVSGFTAGAGYDLASGWGTIDGFKFAHALAGAKVASQSH